MTPSADTLRLEEEALRSEIEQLTREKQGGEAERAAKEESLREARTKLGEAKGGYDEGATYALIKEELRASLARSRRQQLAEIQGQLEALSQHLSRQKALLEEEKIADREDRMAIQGIKARLRDQGIAEYQAYTPSDLGSPERVPETQKSLSLESAYDAKAEMSQEIIPYEEAAGSPKEPAYEAAIEVSQDLTPFANDGFRVSLDGPVRVRVIISDDEDD